MKNLKRTSEALASELVIVHGSTKIWNPVPGNGIRNLERRFQAIDLKKKIAMAVK